MKKEGSERETAEGEFCYELRSDKARLRLIQAQGALRPGTAADRVAISLVPARLQDNSSASRKTGVLYEHETIGEGKNKMEFAIFRNGFIIDIHTARSLARSPFHTA